MLLHVPTETTFRGHLTERGDGGCLEGGSDYWTYLSNATSNTDWRVYDFCSSPGGFVIDKDMNDSTFRSNYVRLYTGASTPAYTQEIKLLSDGLWHILLYNYSLNTYEDIYSVSGSNEYNGGEHWMLFETHYTVGYCSQPPEIEAFGMRVQLSGSWYLVTSSIGFEGSTTSGDCIGNAAPSTTVTFPAGYYDEPGSRWQAVNT